MLNNSARLGGIPFACVVQYDENRQKMWSFLHERYSLNIGLAHGEALLNVGAIDIQRSIDA